MYRFWFKRKATTTGYRYYCDHNLVDAFIAPVESVEVQSLVDNVVIQNVPIDVVVKLERNELAINAIPNNIHICAHVEVVCNEY